MSLSNRCRRLSVAPMAHLERRGRRALGGGGSPRRISHSFPKGSHFIRGAHPFFGLLPQFHPGQSLGAGSGVSAPEGSYRAGSTSFSRLLQPSVCGDESLRVLAAGNRPFSIESQGVEDTIQDGDYPVHSVVSPQRGLDGLHRPQRWVPSGSNPPGFQEVSEVHGLQQGLSIQGPLLRAVHGSAGLHPGHGSGFGHFTHFRHSSSAISGRLIDSGVLPRAGSPVFEDSASSLHLSGDCRQLREVTACSDSEDLLSGSPVGLGQFQGFSSPETCRKAALNWRRISILCGAACKILAGVAGSSFFTNPARSGGTAADVVVSVCASSPLGSSGSRCSGSVVSGDRTRSSVVVKSRPPRTQCFTSASVSPARLVVRRLGCRLGSSPQRPGRFRPLVSRGGSQLHQSAGASGSLLCSPAFSASGSQHLGGRVCGQHDCSGLPEESGRYQVGGLESDSSRSAAVDGAPLFVAPSSVHYGRNNVLADALSRPNQILGSEWTLKLSVFHQLRKRWPVSIDPFATSLNHRCIPYFSPFYNPNSIGTDALLQQWNGWQAYAFPPYALIPVVLKKLRSSCGVLLSIIAPCWPQRPWFPELLELVVDGPVALPLDKDLLSQPHFHQQHLGLSRLVLHAWRLSSDL